MIRIDVRQSDEAIKQQLLRITPIGTSVLDVLAVFQKRLCHDANSTIPVKPSPALSIDLGHYSNPSNYFFPTVVQAIWRFDSHAKLDRIQVRRLDTGL